GGDGADRRRPEFPARTRVMPGRGPSARRAGRQNRAPFPPKRPTTELPTEMAKRTLFTSESVAMGHPDKLADQISDSVLDACLAQDPYSRVACETLLTPGQVVIAGELTTTAQVDYMQVAREALNKVGYTDDRFGICGDTCGIMVSIHNQSPDIAQGV